MVVRHSVAWLRYTVPPRDALLETEKSKVKRSRSCSARANISGCKPDAAGRGPQDGPFFVCPDAGQPVTVELQRNLHRRFQVVGLQVVRKESQKVWH